MGRTNMSTVKEVTDAFRFGAVSLWNVWVWATTRLLLDCHCTRLLPAPCGLQRVGITAWNAVAGVALGLLFDFLFDFCTHRDV